MNGKRFNGTRPGLDRTRSCQYTSIGGQAVLEGVMMRSPNFVATVVCRRDGTIQIRSDVSVANAYPILKKPILRGVVNLIESLIVGIRSLSYSGELAAQDEDGNSNKEVKDSEERSRADDRPEPATSKLAVATSLFFAFVLGIALFVALPPWVYLPNHSPPVPEHQLGKPSEFRALSQEHAHLQEIVQQYRYFKKLNQELSDNKQLLSEKDPEIVLMAKEEIKRLEPEIESVRKKLQILLLPRDPNDNKNIIQVIRAFLPSFL